MQETCSITSSTAKYCDGRVCMSICMSVRENISENQMSLNFLKKIRPMLSIAVTQSSSGSDKSCTSDVMDAVILSHNRPYSTHKFLTGKHTFVRRKTKTKMSNVFARRCRGRSLMFTTALLIVCVHCVFAFLEMCEIEQAV